MTNNNDKKDAAASPNKANEQPQQANSPRRSLTNQEEAVTPPRPRIGSRLETGGSPSVSGPARQAAGTEVGASSPAGTPTRGATPISIPPRIGGSGGGGTGGASGEGSSSRKRSGKSVEEGSSPVAKRGRGEMDINPDSEPTCSTCGRTFASWKAVFGHMRAHPDRGWRGAFPPPEWSLEKPGDHQQGDPSALRSQLAPTLLNLAQETLEKMKQDEGEGGSSTSRRNFDLNTEPPRESTSGSSSSPSGGIHFDLNKTPKTDNNGND